MDLSAARRTARETRRDLLDSSILVVRKELDDERKANFKQLLPPEAQVFATGTSFPSPGEADKWETFRVSSGTFSKS